MIEEVKKGFGKTWHDFLLDMIAGFRAETNIIKSDIVFKEAKVDQWGKALIGRPYKGKTIKYQVMEE